MVDSNNRVQKFNWLGQFVSKWGSTGIGKGQFNNPVAVAVDNENNVYVADTNNRRVQKFDSVGQYIGAFGRQGSADGELQYPTAIVVDGVGNIYVADTGNNRIQKFQQVAGWGNSVAVS